MREYKFRAWDKTHKEMLLWEQYKNEMVVDDFWSEDLEVMQYVGVKDINGIDIYDGDIVIVGQGDWRCSIGYSESSQAFILRDLIFKFKDTVNFMSQFATFEVIGNIFEDPQLLENGGII